MGVSAGVGVNAGVSVSVGVSAVVGVSVGVSAVVGVGAAPCPHPVLTRFIWSSVTNPVSHSTCSSATIVVTGASPAPSNTITTACRDLTSVGPRLPPAPPGEALTSYTNS